MTLDLQPLDSRARERLAKLLQQQGVALDDVLPPAWPGSANDLLADTDIEISLLTSNGELAAVLLDRGWDFPADWVREIWLARVRPGTSLLTFAQTCRQRLSARATHVRWRVPLPVDARSQAAWERLGASVLGIQPPSAEGEPETAVYQIGPQRRWCRSSRGLVIARPRISDLPEITAWSQDEEVFRPLGYPTAPKAESLRELIFPTDFGLATVSPVEVLSIRQGERLVGIGLEYDWDVSGDSTRELDIALPGLERPSPTLLLDSLAALMDSCFCRGARHVLGNVRAAAVGKGFPRLFSRLGGVDVTAEVNHWGRGQRGRCYFAAAAEPFYASTEGGRYAAQ